MRHSTFLQALSFGFASWIHAASPLSDMSAAMLMQSLTDSAYSLQRKKGQRFGAAASANRGRDHRRRLRKIARESRRRNRNAA